MMGLAVAIVVGMTLAICMAQASWMERSIWPYLVAVQAIPILALVPIIGSIFGFGHGSRVFVCFLIAVFPIVSNTLFGLLSADRGQHDLFTLRGASRWTRLRKLQLPAALPAIFTGFRISAGLSVIGAVVGELFFKRGNKGIGILMDTYRSRNQLPADVRRVGPHRAARHRRLRLLRLAQQARHRPVARVDPQDRLSAQIPHPRGHHGLPTPA